MEDIEARRARIRKYGKTHRKQLSKYKRERYQTDSDFRDRCKKASSKWYYKRKRQLENQNKEEK